MIPVHTHHFRLSALLAVVFGGLMFPAPGTYAQDTWRDLVIAPEFRCSPYSPDDYWYSGSIETAIVAELGGVYSPYTGEVFGSARQTDIEHIVARSEAHDSGLCAADSATRLRFAGDLFNLTLAAPGLNRGVKRDRDAADWLPPMNRCWFANRVVEVRRKYSLTVDQREAEVLERVLASCTSTELVPPKAQGADPPSPASSGASSSDNMNVPVERQDEGIVASENVDALGLWDDDGNGRITCAEARRHGIAPVPRGHPAYSFMRDGDGDGVVCE